jgi:hypothetical protein
MEKLLSIMGYLDEILFERQYKRITQLIRLSIQATTIKTLLCFLKNNLDLLRVVEIKLVVIDDGVINSIWGVFLNYGLLFIMRAYPIVYPTVYSLSGIHLLLMSIMLFWL